MLRRNPIWSNRRILFSLMALVAFHPTDLNIIFWPVQKKQPPRPGVMYWQILHSALSSLRAGNPIAGWKMHTSIELLHGTMIPFPICMVKHFISAMKKVENTFHRRRCPHRENQVTGVYTDLDTANIVLPKTAYFLP